MMRRCTECDQLVRLVDPENGCRPWLAEHRTANGKRKCDGSLTGQYVEEGPMAEQHENEELSVAGGNRLANSRRAREFLKTLSPEMTYGQARDAALERGIVLGQGMFYNHRPLASDGPPAKEHARPVPPAPAIDALRELAQLVPRLGGFPAAKSALTLLEELAAATGGAP